MSTEDAIPVGATPIVEDAPKEWHFHEIAKGKGMFEVGGLFGRSEETMTKLKDAAKTAGNADKEIGKISRTKVGLGIAALGAVTWAIAAAVGNKGPGEHAESVSRSVDTEPARG
jgi:hypothetical protein